MMKMYSFYLLTILNSMCFVEMAYFTWTPPDDNTTALLCPDYCLQLPIVKMMQMYSFYLLTILNSMCFVEMAYFTWTPPDDNTTALLCPDYCLQRLENDECCYCDSVKGWELGGTEVNELVIEYISLNGSDAILFSIDGYNNSLPSTVTHTHGMMSAIPSNICSYSEIVKVIFSNNDILTISDISCLTEIETIDLSYNKLKVISNKTFSGLKRLRNLDLSFNDISHIDPNALQGKDRAIFNINLSNLKIKDIDVSNLFFQKGFCKVSYDNNQVSKISNPSGFKVEAGKTYGKGGLLSLNNCSMKQFINYTDIGLGDITEYYKVFNYSFDTEGTDIGCDCVLYPLLEKQFDELEKSWITLQKNRNLNCTSPESLRNVTIIDIVKNKSLREKMVCEAKENCPKECTCYEQPIFKHLVVNCSNVGLKDFPETLPWHANITLLMDGNDLRSVQDADFLPRVHSMNLSGNKISELNEGAVKRMQNNVRLDLSDNVVSYLPRELASKSNVFGILNLECDCEMVWIIDWNTYHVRNKNTIIYCQNYGGKKLENVSDKIKNICHSAEKDKAVLTALIVLSIFVPLIFILSVIFIFFQPELLILYRTYLRRNKHYPDDSFENDVYICLDDGYKCVREWVLIKLVTELEKMGLRVFLPCRDEPIGQSIDESRYSEIDKSRSFIIVLNEEGFGNISTDDVQSATLQLEINHIWHNFRKNSKKKVFVINFDNLASKNVRNRYAKAFLRTRVDVNVTNRHQAVLQRITGLLTPEKSFKYVKSPDEGQVLTRRVAW